jgi:UDP:flavonoid glycosyltransferase YjiC (YdhE family)
MRILFVVADGGGNIPPQLGVARALRRRGARVQFLGHREIRRQIEADDFEFEEFASATPTKSTQQRSLLRLMSDFARAATDLSIGDEVLAVARRDCADIVIVDVLLNAAVSKVAASEFRTVVFVHCFYRMVQDLAGGPIGLLLRLRGIDPLDAERSGPLLLVSARADLDPVRGTPPVRHVWQGTPVASIPTRPKRILVSLSNSAFAGQRRMLQNILDAVAPLPVEAIVTVGPAIDASGLRVPTNTAMHSWLDHDEILPTASMVVGHGGHSTTMRALSFGVPVVVMPANGFIDQKRVGSVLEANDAGLLLPKHARAARIRAAIEKVLGEPRYRASAGRLGDRIRRVDGAEVAADAVTRFAGVLG